MRLSHKRNLAKKTDKLRPEKRISIINEIHMLLSSKSPILQYKPIDSLKSLLQVSEKSRSHKSELHNTVLLEYLAR
jgi:hypothetical protein